MAEVDPHPGRAHTLTGVGLLPLRVALFTDSFQDVNGVGTFCRQYLAYATRRDLPFLCVHGGDDTGMVHSGTARRLHLRRGPLTLEVDAGVYFDPLLIRHLGTCVRQLKAFRPDLVHITGPGDVSLVGRLAALVAGVPVVASWHTNFHEYARRRTEAALRSVCPRIGRLAGALASRGALVILGVLYRSAHFVAAPSEDMVRRLAAWVRRPSFLLRHGVDLGSFSPCLRARTDGHFLIGYVGRLTPEKGVRALVDIERALLDAGERDVRFLVVGEGSERPWLQAQMQTATFAGTLRGAPLAAAFANMDAFVLPSLTDTFGLVILEAMASGVPVVLSPEAGIRAGVVDGVDGIHARDLAAGVGRLLSDRSLRDRIGAAAVISARPRGWTGVFDDLGRRYHEGMAAAHDRKPVSRSTSEVPASVLAR